jgi:sulfopyruvate decarboxylase subunit beta
MNEEVVTGILKESGVRFVVSLPCDRTKRLCQILENSFRYITVPREEDGIGICSGLVLAGQKCVLQMQSSGLGNSLNAIMTLPELYHLSLPVIASWRGYYQEQIAAQFPFNNKIPELLRLYNIRHTIISEPEELTRIYEVIADAETHKRTHVALISPKVWEGEETENPLIFPDRCRTVVLRYEASIGNPVMKRADAIKTIADILEDELVVSNIGVPSKELHAARDRESNFYMLGSYTQATPISLGLALGTDQEVVVLDGDGSLLGTSVLPVVAAEKPENLTIVALDNGTFGSTGNQCTPAYGTIDLELLARAAGIKSTWKVHTGDELVAVYRSGRGTGPRFIHVILKPGNSQAKNIQFSPEEIRIRFLHQNH